MVLGRGRQLGGWMCMGKQVGSLRQCPLPERLDRPNDVVPRIMIDWFHVSLCMLTYT